MQTFQYMRSAEGHRMESSQDVCSVCDLPFWGAGWMFLLSYFHWEKHYRNAERVAVDLHPPIMMRF